MSMRPEGVTDVNDSPDAVIELLKPFPHQQDILDADFRFKAIAAGRRCGKTALAEIACVIGHGPGQKYKGALQGGNVVWVAPSYPMATHSWRDLKSALRNAWQEKREDERWIKLPDIENEHGDVISGGSISVKSGDNPDSLRGIGPDGVVLDECAYMDSAVWYDSLRPAIADHKGWAIFISTPKRDDLIAAGSSKKTDDQKRSAMWFRNLFKQAKEEYEKLGTKSQWKTWQLPSWANPIMTPEEIEEIRRTTSDITFKVEIEAQFVEAGMGLFRPEWFKYYDMNGDMIILHAEGGDEICPLHDLVIFSMMDVAFRKTQTADYTVLSTFGITPQNRMAVLDMRRGKFIEVENQRLIWEAYQKWGQIGVPGSYFIGIEDTAGTMNFILELKLGKSVFLNDNGCVTRIPALPIKSLKPKGQKGEMAKVARSLTIQTHMRNGMVFFPSEDMNVPWVSDAQYELTSFPNPRVHDDIVDTFSYAGIELSLPRFTISEFPSMIKGGKVRF